MVTKMEVTTILNFLDIAPSFAEWVLFTITIPEYHFYLIRWPILSPLLFNLMPMMGGAEIHSRRLRQETFTYLTLERGFWL